MPTPPFLPHPWLRGPHLQTLVPPCLVAPPVPVSEEIADVPVASRAAVRIRIARSSAATRGTVLLVHGLGGSADSTYMRRAARIALARGWSVARMNLRNCGGTERLSETLYNAGQHGDVERVLEALPGLALPRPFAAVGFSLGGNLVCLHAAVAEAGCRADAIAAVSPPLDLDACNRALERRSNLAYQIYFTKLLCGQVRRARRVRPVPGPPATVAWIRTVRRFDSAFTAPDDGFPSAEAYYAASSAAPQLSRVRVPTLVLSAEDDPLVPVATLLRHRGSADGAVRVVTTNRGGHLGYWQARPPRFWAASCVLDFLEEVLNRGQRPGGTGN